MAKKHPSTLDPNGTVDSANTQSATDQPETGYSALREAGLRMRAAAETQRQRAAQAVNGVAGVLHRAADDLNAENQTMGQYTDLAADRLDAVASYLRDADWDGVVDGAQGFARRNPAWFIGGALVTGFVIARAVKGAVAGRADVEESSNRHRDWSGDVVTQPSFDYAVDSPYGAGQWRASVTTAQPSGRDMGDRDG